VVAKPRRFLFRFTTGSASEINLLGFLHFTPVRHLEKEKKLFRMARTKAARSPKPRRFFFRFTTGSASEINLPGFLHFTPVRHLEKEKKLFRVARTKAVRLPKPRRFFFQIYYWFSL
jgi:hypothetical protein